MFTFTQRRSGWQVVVAGTVGFLLPWTGLPACIMAVVAMAVVCALKRECLPVALIAVASIGFGGLTLAAWLHAYDALPAFLLHAKAVQSRAAVVSKGLFMTSVLARLLTGDRSATLLMAAAAALVARRLIRKAPLLTSPAVVVLSILAVASGVRFITSSAAYPWMTVSTLAVGCLAEVGSTAEPRGSRGERACLALAWAGIAASMLMLSAVLCLTALEWHARDHARVEAFLHRHIHDDDRVLADLSAYFTCRRQTQHVIVDSGARGGLPGDYADVDDVVRRSVAFDVAVVRPERAADPGQRLGADWTEVAAPPPPGKGPLDPESSLGGRWFLRIFDVLYPPAISASARERIAPDRTYDLVVLRRKTVANE